MRDEDRRHGVQRLRRRHYAASADMRFGREEHFVVYGQFNDSLGSKVDRNPQLKLSDAAKDALESASSATGYSASASDGALLVMVKEEAAFGDYTIMVTNGRSGDAELTQELTIYVAGPPAEYMVDPTAVYIPLRSRATFTVTAMDEMDGVPAFTTTGDERNDMVQIDAAYGNVRGTKVDSDDVLTLDANTGMGTFTYTLPRDAEQGEPFSIFIGEGDMQVEVMVTAGAENMAPMAGDDVEDQTVYVDAMVEVQSNFSDPDEDMLSYMASSDMMDVATATVDSAGMVTITGVAEGMATITVTASDPMGAYAMQTIMVTVMMMPPGEGEMMTLASNVLGSYLAAVNTFGVTWTPAADAQQQYVVLASLADGYSVVDGQGARRRRQFPRVYG